MKIAFVYDAVYPWVKGGAEKRIYEVGKCLSERGDEVHLFGVKWWEGDGIIEQDGMVLHGVCNTRELYVNGRRSISEALIYSLMLLPHLFKSRFDVIDVSVFPYFSCLSVKCVSIIRRTPAVFTWHEVWDEYWNEYMGPVGYLGKLVERLISKLSSNVVAVSGMTKRDLGLLGVNAQMIHIVPNGVHLGEISAIVPSDDICDVLFVGRLIKEKNVNVLLEAVELVRQEILDIKCIIIGNGPEKEQLIELARTNKLIESNVRFFEFQEYKEVIARMKASKILVLPSSREGFGMVVVEAFACGVPVLTVDEVHNAAAELVDETCGFVVELDAGAIAGALQTLLMDETLRLRLAGGAKEKAQGYDWENIIGDLRDMYEGLM
ncbi:MAG TPA: glycosyltransferase family 4 protein [Candidatus Nanoarchaeia archaeon]|nr:glycosyltransferase family 4 protein [Candidatus Nanoarchaeia archaeon]